VLETTAIGQNFDYESGVLSISGKQSFESVQVPSPAPDFAAEAESLRNGLVGGVKPLPVAIPETGKVLVLAGVLPPGQVTAELEVKAARK
jgi:hypothetical protein